jgi:hypothetical protein
LPPQKSAVPQTAAVAMARTSEIMMSRP